jgi:carbon-monoxide dehydrogenase medium subunit
VIPVGFDYTRAKSLREALNGLAAGDAKLVAGGHSLLPLMRFRLAQPAKLIDIGDLEELRGIEAKGRSVRIGAATTYRDIADSTILAEKYPVIIEATLGIGDTQVRNRGTIGGGLAHADPASDMPAVMLALDATFNLRSKTERRSVPAREFFQGAFTTGLRDDELLYEIILPVPPRKAGMAYVSFEQKASGYPIAAAAAVVTRSRKTITAVTLALAGVGDKAYLADVPDTIGMHGDDPKLDAALSAVADSVVVNSDVHATAEYRAHLARIASRRAIQTAWERAG